VLISLAQTPAANDAEFLADRFLLPSGSTFYLRFNAKVTFGHSALLVTTTSPPEVTTTKAREHQRDELRFPVEPVPYWQVAAGPKNTGRLLESVRRLAGTPLGSQGPEAFPPSAVLQNAASDRRLNRLHPDA